MLYDLHLQFQSLTSDRWKWFISVSSLIESLQLLQQSLHIHEMVLFKHHRTIAEVRDSIARCYALQGINLINNASILRANLNQETVTQFPVLFFRTAKKGYRRRIVLSLTFECKFLVRTNHISSLEQNLDYSNIFFTFCQITVTAWTVQKNCKLTSR